MSDIRIAIWSGPRNLSTALMYAFASRSDCTVWDEPFYAAYLAMSGADHPMRDEIVAHHEADPEVVARACVAGGDAPVHYQKHMAHHMLPEFDLGFMAEVTNAFLIRHPARVIASYHAKREDPTVEDIGAPQLAALYDRAERVAGHPPVVIDSDDIRRAPEPALRALCQALGLSFEPAMLRWEPGGNPADGIWAKHWYPAVHASDGLTPSPVPPVPKLPDHLRPVLDAAMPYYERLRAHALSVP